MRSIKELVGQKVAVRTETSEDFDLVSEALGYQWKGESNWDIHEDYTCVSLEKKRFGLDDKYERKGFDLMEMSEFSEFQSTHPAVDNDDDDYYGDDDYFDDVDDDLDLDADPVEDNKVEDKDASPVSDSNNSTEGPSDSTGFSSLLESLMDSNKPDGIEINIKISNSALQILVDKGL